MVRQKAEHDKKLQCPKALIIATGTTSNELILPLKRKYQKRYLRVVCEATTFPGFFSVVYTNSIVEIMMLYSD